MSILFHLVILLVSLRFNRFTQSTSYIMVLIYILCIVFFLRDSTDVSACKDASADDDRIGVLESKVESLEATIKVLCSSSFTPFILSLIKPIYGQNEVNKIVFLFYRTWVSSKTKFLVGDLQLLECLGLQIIMNTQT